MIVRSLLLVLLLMVSAPLIAQVNALPPTRHILVYGDAQARAVPDRFRLQVSFSAVDPSADVARRRVESHLQDVLDALKALKVPEREIVATSLRIEPRREYDQAVRREVFRGIAVMRDLTVRFADQPRMERFLAGLKTSEEVQVSGVTTELSDEPALREALREKAIASTREKAQTMASAYGATLAGLYSVSDVAPQFDYGVREGSWPQLYQWSRDNAGGRLDRIMVTGSRISAPGAPAPPAVESFHAGQVTFTDRIYAVFLIGE